MFFARHHQISRKKKYRQGSIAFHSIVDRPIPLVHSFMPSASLPASLPPSLFLASCMHACNFIPIISFIHSFIHPCIHPSIHSFIHSLIHSFVHSSMHPSIHPFIHSFTHSFIHSCIHSIIHLFSLFIYSFRSYLLLFIPSMFHSFILLSTNLLSISHACVHSVHSFFHFTDLLPAESFAPEHSWICGFVIISGVLSILHLFVHGLVPLPHHNITIMSTLRKVSYQRFIRQLPSGYVKIAIENDHRNSGFYH